MVYTPVVGEATGADLPDGLADPIVLARSILTMLLDLVTWRQLRPGVYLHRSEPRLLMVARELASDVGPRETVTGADWCQWTEILYQLVSSLYPEIVEAEVALGDCVLIERCDYVV